MDNQYMWLYHNLDRYRYNTEQAKKLHDDFKREAADAESKGSVTDELVGYYNQFVNLFNNNVAVYHSALVVGDIETNELDCYFIDTGRGYVPSGYYKEGRAVECVIHFGKKNESEYTFAGEAKKNTINSLERKKATMQKKQEKHAGAKKPGYVRAVVYAIACAFLLWTSFVFFRITDLPNVIKNIFRPADMMDLLGQNAGIIPILKAWPSFWILVILIVHIILVINILKNIKSLIYEFSMARKMHTAKKFGKYIKQCQERIESSFDKYTEELRETVEDRVRKGESLTIRQNSIAYSMKKLHKQRETANEYFDSPHDKLRGIKSNGAIVWMILLAMLTMFFYNTGDEKSSMTIFNDLHCAIAAKTDTMFLRSKKLVQVMYDDCTLYSLPVSSAAKNETLPIWTKLEVVDSIDGWRKVRKITEDKVISGWVHSDMLCPYNAVTYDAFKKIKVENITSTSNFVENGFTYWPGYAIDSDRATSWRTEYGKGEKLFLTFSEPASIRVIQIFPGNSHSPQAFAKNNRIKKARIKFAGASSVVYEFDDTFNEKYQSIWLNKPVVTDSMEIEILSVYDEYSFTDDLCVGEIHIYGDK